MQAEIIDMLVVQGVFWSFIIIGVLYFGVEAYKKGKEEDFEDREN